MAAAGVFLLIRWFDAGRAADGAAFAVVASLLWRVHLIFWPFYLVFLAYVIIRFARGTASVSGRQAAVIFLVIGVALLPVASRAWALNREAAAHVIAPPPTLLALARSLKLGLVACLCACAWIFSGRRGWRLRIAANYPAGSVTLIVTWWVCQPLCLFAFSWITGNSAFVYRYLYLSLPGAALVATMAAASLAPGSHWKWASLALGVGVLLLLGNWSQWLPSHHNSDWRGAAHAIQALAPAPDTPIICLSPFIEARPPVWNRNYQLPGFLYSQLSAYPIPGRLYPFPYKFAPEAEQFASDLTREKLAKSGRFLIYGQSFQVSAWRDWFAKQPDLTGWHTREMGSFGDVGLVSFEKP